MNLILKISSQCIQGGEGSKKPEIFLTRGQGGKSIRAGDGREGFSKSQQGMMISILIMEGNECPAPKGRPPILLKEENMSNQILETSALHVERTTIKRKQKSRETRRRRRRSPKEGTRSVRKAKRDWDDGNVKIIVAVILSSPRQEKVGTRPNRHAADIRETFFDTFYPCFTCKIVQYF